MTITLRANKSQALTFTELDGNFTDLDGRVDTLETNYIKSVNSVTPNASNELTITTTNIAEGTNLYYTDARARASISVTDSGGDGSLAYNSSTGVITYVGPSASEVRAHFSAGDGITLASGVISVGSGQIKESMIDFGGGAGEVDTDNVPEGATNLYYTDARVLTKINATSITQLSDVDTTSVTPNANDVLTWNAVDGEWEPAVAPGASGGEANTGSSLGSGSGIFKSKVGTDLQFRSLIGTSPIVATTNSNDVTLTFLPSSTVDINTNRVINVVDPVGAQDAATKAYVDARASSGVTIFTAAGDTGSDGIAIQDTLTFSGTANEIETSVAANVVTIGMPSNVTVGNNLTVGGDLTVTGNTISVGATNLSVADQYIYLNTGDAIGTAGTNFTGSGLDDAVFHGYFEGTTTTNYYVRIDATGTPDTFEWSKDNFSTTEATGVAITGAEQALDNNITIEFAATTGHTLNDVWDGTASPIAEDAGIWANENNGAGAYGYTHVGIFWDQSERSWKASGRYNPEPAGNIDVSDASFELGKFEAGEFITGSLKITGSTIQTTDTNQSITIDAAGTGNVSITSPTNIIGDVTLLTQSDLRFADADSSNWVAFQAPATVASNVTWTLPAADAATSGFALVSDAAGTLSWAAAGATTTSDTTTNAEEQIYFGDITSGAVTAMHHDADFTYNPSTGSLTADVFIGALTGNADTATTASGVTANSVALGADTTGSYVAQATTSGVGLSGSVNSETATFTVTSNATDANTASTIVARDSSGDFSAGTITAALSGNATTATSATDATNAANVAITNNTSTNATYYLHFGSASTGNDGVEVDTTTLTYNPSSGTLTTSIFSGTATSAQYADLAEIYVADQELAPGTVVVVGGEAEITAAGPDDEYIAGVISTAPAYLMNSAVDGEAVALVGRVPVRVVGGVNKGEAVFATHNGKASTNGQGKIVGIALETNSDLSEKNVECMLKV